MRLDVKGGKRFPKLFGIIQENGISSLDYSDPLILPDVQRWLERGVTVWKKDKNNLSYTEHYESSDPMFLKELKDHLMRHYRIDSTLTE